MKTHTLAIIAIATAFLCASLRADKPEKTPEPASPIEALYNSRPKKAGLQEWVSENSAAIIDAYANVNKLPKPVAKKLTADYLQLQNAGKQKGKFTNGKSDAKKNTPGIYYRNFATLDELQAAFTTASRDCYNHILAGLGRLNRADLAPQLNEGFLARGNYAKPYQKWFLARLETAGAASRAAIIDAEITALRAIKPGKANKASNTWLAELETTMQAGGAAATTQAPKGTGGDNSFAKAHAQLRKEFGITTFSIPKDDPLYAPYRIAVEGGDLEALRKIYEIQAARK